MSGIISEMENRARTRRMMAGKRARITKRGVALYSNNIPYAYERAPDGNFELVPEELHWLHWLFERRARNHWGYTHIARILTRLGVRVPSLSPYRDVSNKSHSSIWSGSTVRHILRNPFYIGNVRWAGAHNENGTHPHAIDTELWEAAQRVTRQHTIHSQRGASRPGHPLTGLARCAFCEHAMAYVPKEEACGIRCSFYLSTHGTRCTANWQRVEPIHAFVLAAVKRVALDPEAFLEYRQSQLDDGGTQARVDGVNKSLQAFNIAGSGGIRLLR